MLNTILAKIFGSQTERYVKAAQPIVDRINELEPEISALGDGRLREKTSEFKQRLQQGETLDDLLSEAFAVVREASRRTLGMRHYDVQLVGGKVLHEGKIAEMKTGEGKTLVATLPVYLNSLQGTGVHVVTVNDYLARRDAEWMGPIYKFLGLSIGVIQHEMDDSQRRAAYAADVTYGTNNEFGFDYLRDHMKYSLEVCVQRGHHFAIVDEVDSILIDEARTPLIISGPSEESTDKYYRIDKIIPRLVREQDFKVDQKARTAVLLESGIEKAEKALGVDNLYDPRNMDLVHHIQQALKAHTLFKRDKDYMVKDGGVVIVDEFTGRLMPGRRYSDGLHQALEAKEGVKIERENQTLATITFQNYFRMYDKLAGMTGTAETEATEFENIYELQVVVVPTNQALIRIEYSDVVYRTEREKFTAIVDEIRELNEAGRPVLVGTTSIEKSEKLSSLLKRRGVQHVVLNAKYHEKEAQIVAQAGKKGAVTIATNMAGRGTDIILGGNPEFEAKERLAARGILAPEELREGRIEIRKDKVVESGEKDESSASQSAVETIQEYESRLKAEIEELKPQWQGDHDEIVGLGGLHIIGTERHEARRIDNQLRGRAGRQGDPGSSRFYLSLEDDLLRIFGSDRISGLMQNLGMEEGVPIESKLITRQIERAQTQVEARNFEIRKHLLEYDDVMNKQREEIYRFRRDLLEGQEQREYVMEMAEDLLLDFLDEYARPDDDPEDWELDNLRVNLRRVFGVELPDEIELFERIPEEEGLKAFEPVSESASSAVSAKTPLSKASRPELENYLLYRIYKVYDDKEKEITPKVMRFFEQMIMLQVIDQQWKDHLLAVDHLKEGIGLRGYAQRDPKIEYKRESFALFEDLTHRVKEESTRMLFLLRPISEAEEKEILSDRARQAARQQDMQYSGGESESAIAAAAKARPQAPSQARGGGGGVEVKTFVRNQPKIGRNDPCPCGSGKKYKKCCGG
ncbi:MAG TPA: preprotein translocase subunit SecA [Acidobacteriota bacterium]|nr:preprotein translocase subunit SecA [Acidobacteriota bacterium]